MRGLVSGACVLALSACDNRDALREPEPGLERMLEQPRADPYEATTAFPDGRVMQLPPQGTIPHDVEDERAPPLTRGLLALGRNRFETFCAPCHGMLGTGESVVASKMAHRPPPTLHEPRIRALTPAGIYTVVTSGYGIMGGYANQLVPEERWAVIAYLRALWLSQAARVQDLPEDVRRALEREAP